MTRVGAALLGAFAFAGLAGCSGPPNLHDLPPDIAAAKPNITAEQADFVLDANRQGAAVTAASLDDDLESGITTCWAAGIRAFCPDYSNQIGQLKLP